MTQLQRFDPFREIDTLQRQMNHLFDDFIAPTTIQRRGNAQFIPAAELEENEESFSLRLEVPGMKPEELSIEVTAESVSISGERKSATPVEGKGGTRSEFHYGHFERVIPLSSRVQNTEATAEYRDGILHLTLPKAEEEKNKVVKISLN
ncbi:MAG: Hsp20/alpha crystallin family protein [Cyanobacteria bacterium P01_E01_bin.6]